MKRILAAALALLFSCHTLAAPVAVAEQDGIKVTLHSDECRLTKAVTNLPYRATWTEQGKMIEGCFTVFGGAVVAIYFADKTVAVAPVGAFAPLQSM